MKYTPHELEVTLIKCIDNNIDYNNNNNNNNNASLYSAISQTRSSSTSHFTKTVHKNIQIQYISHALMINNYDKTKSEINYI